MVWQPYSSNTRVFTYSACTSTSATNNSPADCAAKPLLQARFAFYDYPSAASISSSPPKCQLITSGGSCGENMTEISWLWNPVVPAVSPTLSPNTGPIAGGTTVTIQGTGFTGGDTVNFVQENPTSGAYNPPLPAAIVANSSPGCSLPTCIQVTSPVVTSGTAYYVTVTTPGGTSQTTTSDFNSYVPTFTYTPATPTVSAIVGTNAGSITGGTAVLIQGTGFWSDSNSPQFPTQVFFCPTAGGSCTPGSVLSVTSPATGSSFETMTALAPAVSAAGTYYVQVESYNRYSTSQSVIFTYNVQVPIVISISTQPATNPTSGGAGTTLTITGANFLTGSTVGFCADTGGNYVSACQINGTGQTMATLVSLTPTQITVTVPTLPGNGTYYPIVTLPSQYSTGTYPPSQPYNEPADTFTYT